MYDERLDTKPYQSTEWKRGRPVLKPIFAGARKPLAQRAKMRYTVGHRVQSCRRPSAHLQSP
jgi:hypothetical protein